METGSGRQRVKPSQMTRLIHGQRVFGWNDAASRRSIDLHQDKVNPVRLAESCNGGLSSLTHPNRLMEAYVKTVDIIYRYEARDTPARPQPADSNAALLRLNGGNSDFAALLDHVNDESGIQRVIPVDPRDLGFGS